MGILLEMTRSSWIPSKLFPDNKQCLYNCVHNLFVATKTGLAIYDLENPWYLKAIGVKDPMIMETSDEEGLRKFNKTTVY